MSAIDDKYAALADASMILGNPISEEMPTIDGVGRFREFEYGSIYWTPQLGSYEIHGDIYKRWVSLGKEESPLGYPVSDELAAADGIGRYSQFEYGTIYWTQAQGAIETIEKTPQTDFTKALSYFGTNANLLKDLVQKAVSPTPDSAVSGTNDAVAGITSVLADNILTEVSQLENTISAPVESFLSPAQLSAIYQGNPQLAAIIDPLSVQPGIAWQEYQTGDQINSALDQVWTMPRQDDISGSATSRGRTGVADSTGVNSMESLYTRGNLDEIRTNPDYWLDDSAVMRTNIAKVAIALSGGGAKGDFEVGALRFIYDRVLGNPILKLPPRPDIVTGTSVGAINGVKIAEGQHDSLNQLENIWSELSRNEDMYLPVLGLKLEELLAPLGNQLKELLVWAIGNLSLLTGPLIIFGYGGVQNAVNIAQELISRVKSARSIYNLEPIKRRLDYFSPFWASTGPGLRGSSLSVGYDRSGRTVIAARGYNDGCYVTVKTSTDDAASPSYSYWVLLGFGVLILIQYFFLMLLALFRELLREDLKMVDFIESI